MDGVQRLLNLDVLGMLESQSVNVDGCGLLASLDAAGCSKLATLSAVRCPALTSCDVTL